MKYTRIKNLCNEKNISVEQFANELGINPDYINDYIDGTQDMSISAAFIISRYFNVSCDYLSGLSDDREIKIQSSEDLDIALSQGIDILIDTKTGNKWKRKND